MKFGADLNERTQHEIERSIAAAHGRAIATLVTLAISAALLWYAWHNAHWSVCVLLALSEIRWMNRNRARLDRK